MYVRVCTHLVFYLFVCLFGSFAGQPLPLSCSWSPGGMDEECAGGKRGVLQHDSCLGPGP